MERSGITSGEVSETIAASPFGNQRDATPRFQFPIALMMVLIVVCMACFSITLMALRIPEVQGLVRDLFGGSKGARSTDYGSHLRFLMVCYSAPLMITGLAGVVYYVSVWVRGSKSEVEDDEDDSPFS
ncbi:hypothetical protein SH449x_003257 [Pirellulaceae bacterium SH449]